MICLLIYKKDTGDVVAIKTAIEDDRVDTPTHGSLIADVDPAATDYFVRNGVIVNRPSRPSRFHQWSGSAWLEDADGASIRVRQKRDTLLAQSDWSDLSSAPSRLGGQRYQQWQKYRQELRDLTKQPGFPLNVVWPVAPE